MARYRFNPLLIALYMLPALAWWAHMLWKNNEIISKKEIELLSISKPTLSPEALAQTPEYQAIERKLAGKRKMVIGEGTVFFLFLLGGLWYVYRTYQKERELSKRQNNFQLSITHELKTPITSMQLVFDTLRRHTQLAPEQVQNMAATGKKESVRLLGMVNDILLSGQLESHWTPNPREVDLRHLVQECIQSAQTLYPETKFATQIAADAQTITADQQGLSHILMNLVENAAKYSPKNSEVTLSSKKDGKNVLLCISDEGIGIAPDQREKVFRKFYRGGNEETRETKGTGLGLFIVKQIVEAHGGSIKIKNNVPTGTVFEVRI
jgi:signal transduction histidine kinase